MRELSMDIEWRTVQMFLEPEGVCEVEIDAENSRKVRCSCPSFSNSARCKHTKFVKRQLEENNGNYQILIPEEVDDEEAFEAMTDPYAFRNFIIKYGKVEVLD